MTDTIFCQKLKKTLARLESAPYPGEIGKKIFNTISKEAWRLWLERQTILINEYRLSMIDPKARAMLEKEMLEFLFEDKDSDHFEAIPKENFE